MLLFPSSSGHGIWKTLEDGILNIFYSECQCKRKTNNFWPWRQDIKSTKSERSGRENRVEVTFFQTFFLVLNLCPFCFPCSKTIKEKKCKILPSVYHVFYWGHQTLKLYEMNQWSRFIDTLTKYAPHTYIEPNEMKLLTFIFFRILKHSICDRMMMEGQLQPWTCWFQG